MHRGSRQLSNPSSSSDCHVSLLFDLQKNILSTPWLCLARFDLSFQDGNAASSRESAGYLYLDQLPCGDKWCPISPHHCSRKVEQPYSQQKPFILVILFHLVRYTRVCCPWLPTSAPKPFQKIVRQYVCWMKTTQQAVVYTYHISIKVL